MRERRDRADQRRERSGGQRRDSECDGDERHDAGNDADDERRADALARGVRNRDRMRGVAHVVGGERDAPLAGRRAGCAHRDRDVGGAERAVVTRGVTDDGHDVTRLCQRAHVGAAIARKDLRANVLDVERASDRLTRLARLAAEEHRLHARIEQTLHGRARAGAHSVLEREKTGELLGDGHEKNAAPLGLELRHPRVGQRDADLLLHHERAAPDDEPLARRRERGHAETRVHDGVAHVVRAHVARARRAEDRGRERMRRRGLGAGGEREHARDVVRADGVDGHNFGLAHEHRAARAEHRRVGLAGALEGARVLVDDAARERAHLRARVVKAERRRHPLGPERERRGRCRREHFDGRCVAREGRDTDQRRGHGRTALERHARDARSGRRDVDTQRR